MRLTTLIILLLAFIKSEAQTHAEEYYQFDCTYKTMLGYYNRGLYHKAVLYSDSLVGNKYVNASTNYFCARVYALSNEFDKTLEYLEKAVKGGITKSQVEKMYDLDVFRESNMNIVFNLNYEKWHQEYEDSRTYSLDSVYIKDIQKISKIYSNNFKLRKVEGDEIIWVEDSTNYYHTRKRLDSTIFYAIIDLTIEKGFPTYRTIGNEYYNFSRYLRYNMPDDYDDNCKNWQKIKTLIFNEIEKGTVFPFYYAALEDGIRLGSRRPQLYGTMPIIYNKNTDVSNGIQYETPEELNIRRRTVGLCPIQLELWSQARELPESLKGVTFK